MWYYMCRKINLNISTCKGRGNEALCIIFQNWYQLPSQGFIHDGLFEGTLWSIHVHVQCFCHTFFNLVFIKYVYPYLSAFWLKYRPLVSWLLQDVLWDPRAILADGWVWRWLVLHQRLPVLPAYRALAGRPMSSGVILPCRVGLPHVMSGRDVLWWGGAGVS